MTRLSMTRPVTAIIPVKALDIAKQRLSPQLTPAERRALVIAMLRDVLHAIAACPGISQTIIATADPFIATLAPAATISIQDAATGMNEAIAAAIRITTTETALILPGDIPCITPAELAALLADHRGCSIVPSHDGTGTNALLLTPPAAIGLAYGPGSFGRHLAAARTAGLSPDMMRLPGIGLDIDTHRDLRHCTDAGPHTARLLEQWRGALAAERLTVR